MQFIKKVGAILLSVCFCGAMCACATGDPDPEPGRDPQTESGVFAEDLVTNGRTFVSADDGFDHSYARIVESDAGTLIATAEELNNIFRKENIMAKYGASTTWMGKLLSRLDSRRNGGCPVLAVGIRKGCVEEYG